MSIEITKIKLGRDREIHYKRFTHAGTEHCQLVIERGEVSKLAEKMRPLLDEAIEIIGLDSDRWDSAEVIGVSFKATDDGTGATISLLNKEELAVCCNTPYLSPDNQSMDMEKALKALLQTTAEFIEQQPAQMELLVHA